MRRIRWRIMGRLTLTSPLHIGDGNTTTREGLMGNDGACLITAVCTTPDPQDGRRRLPYIPGNSLKGVLRTWLLRHADRRAVELLLGSDSQNRDGVGSRVVFCDAIAQRPGNWDAFNGHPRVDQERLTAVATNVAIARKTKTARHQKLYYTEYVPEGVSFSIEVSGDSANEQELDSDISLILPALEAFSGGPDRARLGANDTNGWGRCTWTCDDIAVTSEESVRDWLAGFSAAPQMWCGGTLRSFDTATRERLCSAARRTTETVASSIVRVAITLRFDGPFLVNDPLKTKESTHRENDPNHFPMLTPDGRALLRASAVRGPLRAQAERIIRTLNPDAACDVTDVDNACPAVLVDDGETECCLACQLFGATGWGSPIEIGDFVSDVAYTPQALPRQEFVAIDRFTGGGVRSAKYNATYVECPTLTGTIRIDVRRMKEWGWGLLALLTRDLIEGDVRFGFGATKGYGACTATIQLLGLGDSDIRIPGDVPADQQAAVRQYANQFRNTIAAYAPEEANHAVPQPV